MSTITYRQAATIIGSLSGKNRIIGVPITYVDLTDGDHVAALFLQQVLYWTQYTKDENGWFYKTGVEWYEELRLTYRQISRVSKLLKPIGLETKLKKHKGAPKTFYRINFDVFIPVATTFTETGFSPLVKITKSENHKSAKSISTKGKKPDFDESAKSSIYSQDEAQEDLSLKPKPPNPVSDIPHPNPSFSEESDRTSLIPDDVFAKIANQCEQLESQHLNTQTNTTASLADKKQRSTQITKNLGLDQKDCAATFFSQEDKVITPPKENACLKAEQNFVNRSQALPEYRTSRGPNGVKADCLDAIAGYLSTTPHYLDRKVKANRANAKNFIYKHEGEGKQDLIVDLYQEYRVKPKIESQEQPSTPSQAKTYDDAEDNLYNLPKVWKRK